MSKFFEKKDYFWEYDYPFGEDFLKNIFDSDQFKRKYSLSGDGIFNLILIDNKIYNIDLKEGKSLLVNDGKKAFRDETKDIIVEKICNALKDKGLEYTTNSGKLITFKYNNVIFKIEIVKKAAMPS